MGPRVPWLILIALGTLATACGDDEPAAEPARVEEPASEPVDEPADEPEPEPEAEPEPEPECSFLECGEVPNGVDGAIGTLTPGPPCIGGEAVVIVPEDVVQGDRLFICVPELVTRLAPYRITITGPNGVVFDETRETPQGIPPIVVGATPAEFPTGPYRVNVSQDQPSLVIDEAVDFSVDLATSPRVLAQEDSPSTVRVWVTGEDSDTAVEVDFYLLTTDEGCVYRGTETIATDGNGVGSEDFQTDDVPSGAYFAFSRSTEARACVREDFRVS